MPDNGTVDLAVEEHVGIITLKYEERLNALSQGIRDGLWRTFRDAEADPEVEVIVVTGAGDKSFCAGADLKEMTETGMAVPDVRAYMPQLGRNIRCDKPVIAAVNGYALGGGLLLAQMCDILIAAENAEFGMPEARWGRGAPWSVPLMWKIPKNVWAELAMMGKRIDAQRAYEIGLANVVVPRGEALSTALEWAAEIRKGAPLTLRATKRMLDTSTGQVTYPAWQVSDALFEEIVYQSTDALEGPRSYAEGRPAVWARG
ncbi:enoyl-CoA hydratase/isomerase family protein [Dactylosporangium salmoneum]|uniref:Enoyl-CoA hydratase-related protein n=1 Tax=Dactylosporangium salmoneum TaxID=53361 RepID=A0ABP5SWN9_9ACTN